MPIKFISLLIIVQIFGQFSCWPIFHLYLKSNPSKSVVIDSQNISFSGFSHLKDTKFLVHGFGDSASITRLNKVKDQFLLSHDINVIVVDWEQGALAPDYLRAVDNVRLSGQRIANFVNSSKILTSKVHCIGHSLGAHVCGFAGKASKLKRISGLDPAGPSFKGKTSLNRLDKGDAEYVDVIHTDWVYGIQDAIGHKDFYPNGGASQYGCNWYDGTLSLKFDPIDLVACSHMRVPLYYAESINSQCRFTSIKCDNYDNFENGKCSCSGQAGCSSMGYWSTNSVEEGKFYLDTNKADPYCKN